MRGLFTAGVLDVLMERGVKFDGAIGVSAGACFGCNYKSGQIGRADRAGYPLQQAVCQRSALLLMGFAPENRRHVQCGFLLPAAAAGAGRI